MNPSDAANHAEKTKRLEAFGKQTRSLYDELINDINNGNNDRVEERITQLSAEELELLARETQKYKSIGTASSNKFVLASISNLRERYLKKLTTTAMVSFLYQMEKEHTVDDNDLIDPPKEEDFVKYVPQEVTEELNFDAFYTRELLSAFKTKFPDSEETEFSKMEKELTDDELLDVNHKATQAINDLTKPKKVLDQTKWYAAIEAAVDEQTKAERAIVRKFLDKLFKYDPIVNVQEGLQPVIVDDPERNPTRSPDDVYTNVPSNDTHCQFSSYYEVNYEKLRQATLDLYNVKPDLEHALIVYDVLDTQKDVDAWMHKYGSSAKYDIVAFPLNCWTIQGSFKENRARIDYYNKNNGIIKSMLDQQEKDANLGEELMKKRIKTKKVRSQRVFGKDSPEFGKYQQMNPSDLESKYGVEVTQVKDESGEIEAIKVSREVTVNAETGEELKVDETGIPENGLEVPITNINAATGASSQTRFFTEAVN